MTTSRCWKGSRRSEFGQCSCDASEIKSMPTAGIFTHLRTRMIWPCFLPLIPPLRPFARLLSQRATPKHTKIPGVRPTNLGRVNAHTRSYDDSTYPKTSSWLFRSASIPLIATSTSTLVFWIWMSKARIKFPRIAPMNGVRRSVS